MKPKWVRDYERQDEEEYASTQSLYENDLADGILRVSGHVIDLLTGELVLSGELEDEIYLPGDCCVVTTVVSLGTHFLDRSTGELINRREMSDMVKLSEEVAKEVLEEERQNAVLFPELVEDPEFFKP